MQVRVLDNVAQSMLSTLVPEVARASDVRVAIAFLSRGGLALLHDSIAIALQSGAHVEFLVGMDMRSTDPEAVSGLHELSQTESGLELYCYASPVGSAIYHPKMYLLRAGDEATAIIGSSNLTEGGLTRNIEVNLLVRAAADDELISDVYSTYSRMKFLPGRFVPDDEYLQLYQQLYARQRDQQRAYARDSQARALIRTLEEKSKSLRPPVPSKRDLVGWPALVYRALPEGEFTTRDVYEHERDFRQRYPDNANVRAKIRQQLQVLRDIGLLQHVARARWRKH